MQAKETVTIDYGNEEGDFYLHQVSRSTPYERNNHYHATYEVYYQLSGRRHYFIKDSAYAVAPGDLVFINKHDVHKTSVLGSPQHERIVMNFSDAFLGAGHPLFKPELLAIFARGHHLYRLKPSERMIVEQLFRRMTEELKQQEDGFDVSIRLLVAQLLVFALRLKNAGADAAADPLSPTHRRIAEVVKHINARYEEKLPLPALSERFGMSPSYLSRTFKQVTGFSVVGYQNLTRIREAQTLLATTRASVADISARVGFEQFAHFNRTFKKITGTNPRRYRSYASADADKNEGG